MKCTDERPKESKRFLSTLMSNLPGMAYRCYNDKKWTMEFVSEGCLNLTGYKPSQLIQNREVSYGQLIHPEDKERVWKETENAIEKNEIFRITYRITTATGEQKWLWEQGTGVFAPEGNLVAIEGFITDISEQKIAYQKIEHLNRVLRAIRNINQLIVRERDRTKLLKGICKNLTENRGYHNSWIALLDDTRGLVATAEVGLGKTFLPMIKRLQHAKLTNCVQKALKKFDVIVTEDPFVDCEKCPLSKMYAHRAGMAVRLEHGDKVYGILVVSVSRELASNKEEQDLLREISRDIALGLYRMELEEKSKIVSKDVQDSEQRFRNLVENSLTGISIIQDNQIVYQNQEQQKLLGPLPRSPKFEDLKSLHPDDAEKVKEFYQNITSKEFQTLDMDFRFYSPGKMNIKSDMRWVNCRAIKIEYQGKEAVLVNLMDITKTKEMEHLLRIQDKMTSLGRVAAGIAHEIRNPLSGINVYLDTLQNIYDKEESLEKVKRIIEQLQSASNRIKSVIKRVMDFSQPSAPKYALIDINQPIEEAFNLSSVTMRKSGITIERNLTENLPLCRADPRLIEEVVLNLITNADEALKNVDGPKIIEITSSVKDNNLVIRVADSGPGVSSNVWDQIFDPFYTTKDGGTGIGLSISHRIITDHNGSLGVSVSKWGGAEFIIEIPLKKE